MSNHTKWQVVVLMENGNTATTDPHLYTSEADATIAAKRAHAYKPFLNYVVVGSPRWPNDQSLDKSNHR